MEKEDKENAYLTCGCAAQCYSVMRREELYRIALQTNNPEDWGKVPMVTALVDCFNKECLMHKDYKQAATLLDKRRGYRK